MSWERTTDVQRLRHVAGQMLRSRDFRDQTVYDAELMAWHQRALHDAYGVVEGLGCRQTGDVVEISPGLAFDSFGRALQVLAPRRVKRPAAPRAMTLVIRHSAADAAELVWVDPRAPDPRAGVELATSDGPGLAIRSRAVLRPPTTRVLARPRIGSGATSPDGTAWEPWVIEAPDPSPLGLEVLVDTAAAGFTQRPCYFAWLVWPGVASARVPTDFYLKLATQYVVEESTDGFTFRVLLRATAPSRSRTGGGGAVTLARAERLHVAWLGVQADDEETSS